MVHGLRSFADPGRGGRRLGYLQYVPPAARADPTRRWPLILFLHGSGERGRDARVLTRHGIPRVVEESRGDLPFIALAPQCPPASAWPPHLLALEALLADALDALPVDPARLYLTGISMGGEGAWHLGARNPHRFAAVVPICGYGLPAYGFPAKVCALKDTPVWTFHGARDTIVRPAATVALVETLRGCGGDVRLTIYPDADHDSWTRTYANPEVYEWLLAQRLRARG
ncbi:MAG TPA: dienelactone hydrolase family protein [Polyangia bacterium]